ncbi:MAG: DUF488 domain-containing protein [Pirellulales bacterium]|nr:DUF488 domain-containing protein [Pirellulales bacterium]
MLKRQRAVIWLLREMDRPVSSIELTKWCFLLRHEFASRGGSAFYDFVAYRYGPFSFCLFQELGKLETYGYVRKDPRTNTYQVDLRLASSVALPDDDVSSDISRLSDRFGGKREKSLIDYVYKNYAAFTIRSEIRRLAKSPRAKPRIYTAGYEGLSADAFLDMLSRNGIKRLIDVRSNPIARRYGFHKSTLARLTGYLDIEYVHFPQLGIRSEERQSLDSKADYERLFEAYENEVLASQRDAISEVASLMRKTPSALLCMEKEANCCHRSRLAASVSELTGLATHHLAHGE